MSELIRVEDVEKYYGAADSMTKAVNRISFTVRQGEFVGIMGASGSGKSTLLNLLATVDTVTSGHIYFEGKDITGLKEDAMSDFRKENLGFVFQDFNLLDTLTIGENISLALSLVRISAREIRKRTDEIMKRLGIFELKDKFPYQVSGGQKQRCACARALIHRPKIILADEPTGALDSRAARTLMQTFTEMNEQMDATILMVTHDAFSASYCSRILFLRDGQIFHELRKPAGLDSMAGKAASQTGRMEGMNGKGEGFAGNQPETGVAKEPEGNGRKPTDPPNRSSLRKEFLNEILDVLSLTGGEEEC